MVFFANFPAITVDFTQKTDSVTTIQVIQDLSTNIAMTILPQDLDTMCLKYTIKDGELPESLSIKFYGNPDYGWTIQYVNGIANINNEWPLNGLELLEYVSNKYGASNINALNCYQKIPEGFIMDQTFITDMYGSQFVQPMTNMDIEDAINEQKRFIYIIKPENLTRFVSTFNSALAS